MKKFWESLKENSIYKVGAVYTATTFVIIHFVDMVFPALHLPEWSVTLVVVLVLIGFPITLVIAWASSPKKVQVNNLSKNKITKHSTQKPKRKISWARIVISSLATLAITIGGYFLFIHLFYPYATLADKSIAVLPFKNLSDNKEDEYFTEGMTDEIMEKLSKMSGLTVFSRTSTEQYKNTIKPIKQIGMELGVQTLLEGSVQKIGNDLKVIVQLIDAKTDEHIWAKTYNRQMSDVFTIQSDIAQEIANELGNNLLPKEKKLIESKPTDNLQAYNFYLRAGKYFYSYHYSQGFDAAQQAERLYKAAIALDPKFIEARASLSKLYTLITWYNTGSLGKIYSAKAKEVDDSMVAVNSDKPCVHEALAYFKYRVDRDYIGALNEYDIALAGDPNNNDVLTGKAYVFRHMGLMDSAIVYLNKAAERSPNYDGIFWDLAQTYYCQRKGDEAIAAINKALVLQPESSNYFGYKVEYYIALKGDLNGARKVLDQSKILIDTNSLLDEYHNINFLKGNYTVNLPGLLQQPDSLIYFSQDNANSNAGAIADIYYLDGKIGEAKRYYTKARDILLAKIKTTPDDFRLYAALGSAYAGLGESDLAIENGKRAQDMMPTSKDALSGEAPLENLADIYTALGKQDEAIDILEQLMKMPMGWYTTNSIPLLKLEPGWKPLRNNPRFKKLVGEG